MLKYGVAPFLECSTRGDRRFSPFCAKVNGKSIEDQYQEAKVFADGSTGLSWQEAKGRRAVNQRECALLYSQLWQKYIAEHPELHPVLMGATGLCDYFGHKGGPCQASELWLIRHNLLTKGTQ
jgi:hypothetical protein